MPEDRRGAGCAARGRSLEPVGEDAVGAVEDLRWIDHYVELFAEPDAAVAVDVPVVEGVVDVEVAADRPRTEQARDLRPRTGSVVEQWMIQAQLCAPESRLPLVAVTRNAFGLGSCA